MRIGDKVRMLRGVEEGQVIRLVSDKLVEIETTDGFTLPVLKSELVVVASEEKDYFDKEDIPQEAVSKQSIQDKGVFIAFEGEEGQNSTNAFFINNSENNYAVIISEINQQGLFSTLIQTFCNSSDSLKIGNYNLNQFESWPTLAFHLTQLNDKSGSEPQFIKKLFTSKAKNFFKKKTTSPLRNNPAFVFNLLEGSSKIDTTELKEQLESSSTQAVPFATQKEESREVDLHIELLREDHVFLSPEEILPIQVSEFEKELDKALADNCLEITFIHGIGSGKLKYEISKVLSRHPHVKYYQDADKQKFGYGATKAVF